MVSVYRKLCLGIIFFTCILGLWFFADIRAICSFQTIMAHKHLLDTHIAHYPVQSAVLFLALYILFVTLALPITALLTITAGCLFGPVWGTVIAITGATLGAVCGFLLVRSWLGPLAQQYLARVPRAYRRWLSYGPYYLFFIRSIPLVPFGVATTIAALSGMTLGHFTLATFLGVIPTKLAYSAVGVQCSQINRFEDLFSAKFMIQYSIIIVCVTLPILFKLMYNQKGES